MLTTTLPGVNRRQAVFFFFLIMPIVGMMLVLGLLLGLATSIIFPIVLTAAIIGVIGTLIVLGLNWRIGLYLIMFFVLWDRVLGFGPTGALNATKIAIALTVIFMLTAIVNGQLTGWWRRLGDPLVVVAFLYVLITALPLPYMAVPEIALEYVQRRATIVVLLLIMMIAISDREVFHRAIIFLVIGGTLVGIATTSEAFTGVGLLERMGKSNPDIGSGVNVLQTYEGSSRLSGPSGGPNFYGLAQSLPAVLAFGLLLYYKEMWKKALCTAALGIMLFNIAGSGSRSGALALLAGVSAVFFLCPVKHRLIKFAVAMTVIVAGVLILVSIDTGTAIERITSPGDAARPASYRITMWQMAVHMWIDHPFTGVGTNAWGFYYEYYRIPPLSANLLRPHNSFTQILAENGIQGVIVYFFLFVFAIINAFSAAFGTMDRRLKFEAMAIASVTIGFLTFAGTQNVLENELYFLVFGLCGATYNIYRLECAEKKDLGPDQLALSPKYQRTAILQARQNAKYPPGT